MAQAQISRKCFHIHSHTADKWMNAHVERHTNKSLSSVVSQDDERCINVGTH